MCIVVCSSKHPKYSMLVISNRDEYFDRPTQGVCYVKPNVIRPMDLARTVHGTWIGVTIEGKIAVLVNYREPLGDGKSPISRGLIPISYLESQCDSPLQWAEETKREMDGFKNVGGFSLLFGDLSDDQDGQGLYIMSSKSESVLNMKKDISIKRFENTLALSNSTVDSPWPKVLQAEQFLEDIISSDLDGKFPDEGAFFNAALGVLDHYDSRLMDKEANMESAFDLIPESIFVPPLASKAGLYGTRTQTLIAKRRGNGECIYLERDALSGSVTTVEYMIKDKFGDSRMG